MAHSFGEEEKNSKMNNWYYNEVYDIGVIFNQNKNNHKKWCEYFSGSLKSRKIRAFSFTGTHHDRHQTAITDDATISRHQSRTR
ncbi:hypothetical protein [Alysiella crassa]|uniref:hypothetical protein n=1 Tax=Alysiella crassa TaxID=153491 RepID=UPI0011C056D4|nr:hypothetical protein [Alysiella crassa]UOP06771.1 hypothetical protein LVJ80_13810 [Alysiella crassa]